MVGAIDLGATKAALEALWSDRADVYILEKSLCQSTGQTLFSEKLLFEALPCRLSYRNLSTAGTKENAAPFSRSSAGVRSHAAPVTQTARLFLSRETTLPPGCKIVVTRNAGHGGDETRTAVYAFSGEAGVFTSHQEVALELFKKWS